VEALVGKLIVSTHMTVDGVIDSTDQWFTPDGETERLGFDQLVAADALLLGRKTYEGLAGVWPTITDTSGFADRMNSLPKFVASRTLEGPLEWNATLITGDLAEGVSSLKQEHDGNLLVYGCGALAYQLARHGLVDEIRFWVHPMVWGSGIRPFHGGEPVPLCLTDTTIFRSGVALLCYQPESDQ
jgi:dihydrofolate reductase